jgi:hypothetical protein
MVFPDKKLTIGDRDIVVSCEKLEVDHCHRYRFTAKVGEHIHEHTMTIGPSDGSEEHFLVPSQEQFQKDVDEARQQTAKRVVARLAVSELEGQIV